MLLFWFAQLSHVIKCISVPSEAIDLESWGHFKPLCGLNHRGAVCGRKRIATRCGNPGTAPHLYGSQEAKNYLLK